VRGVLDRDLPGLGSGRRAEAVDAAAAEVDERRGDAPAPQPLDRAVDGVALADAAQVELDAGAVDALDRLVPSLARIEDDLVPMAERLARSAGEGLLVAILAVPSAEEAAALARCRLGFGGALGLLIRADSWLGLAAREGAAADAQAAGSATLLERAGWRTAMLSRTQPLDEPWRRLTAPLGRTTLTTRKR